MLRGNSFYMTEICDESLVSLAAEGDKAAFDKLAARYIPVVALRASAFYEGNAELSNEDLGQEGFIGLIDAVKRYDENIGASFRTFAVLCIDRRMKSVIKASFRKKKIPKDSLVFIDDEDTPEIAANETENPENKVIALDEHRLLLERIRECASDFEWMALNYFLNGMSYQLIADRLKTSEKSVANALGRIRRKLTQKL